MTPTLADFLRDLPRRWVALVSRWAGRVALLALMLVAGAGYLTVTRLGINTDNADMLDRSLPFRRDYLEYQSLFPQFTDTLLIVLDGPNVDAVEDAATLLAQGLRRNPDLFGPVFDPAGDPFFRRNGLLYLDIDALYALGDHLAAAQPFLGTLARDPTLVGLFRVLGLAVDEAAKSKEGDTGQSIKIGPALEAIAETTAALAAGRQASLSWRDLMTGQKTAAKDRRRFLVIKPPLDFSSLQPAGKAIGAVRALAAGLDLDLAGVRMRMSGAAALAEEELTSVADGMGLAAALSGILVLALLSLGLRSRAMVAATLATLIAGLIWTAGFATLAVGNLNLISVAFAVLFIGLSVDFGIHFALRTREAQKDGLEIGPALEAAAQGVGGTLTLCAVAAAIGFFSFLPTNYTGLAELGLISGVSMFIALFANLTLLPALLTLMPPGPPGDDRAAGRWGDAGRTLVRDHARTITLGAVVAALGAAALAPSARFDFDPMALRDPKTESVSVVNDLLGDARTNPYSIAVVADSLAQAQTLAHRLRDLEPVERAVTLADYVPSDQEEKLEIIASTALFLAPSLNSGVEAAPATAAERAAARDAFTGKLRHLARSAAAAELRTAAEGLAGLLETYPKDLSGLETALLGGLGGRLDSLKASLEAAPVTLDSLPADLRDRELALGGRARIEIFPKADMRDQASLIEFVEAVRSVAPRVTGTSVIILEAGNAVVAAFRQAAIISVLGIAALTILLLRRVREVLLIFAPLGLAALLTVAASAVLDLPFNFANVIVLPLLFGLGVAGAIHLVMRERSAKAAATGDALATSTPRAVVFSALTTIGSFSTIALSSHPGTASMGVLLAISITLTLICTLVVLPALMALGQPRRD